MREAFQAGSWSDLGSNALIGHGNGAAIDWYWVAEHDERQMHIGDFVCRKASRERRQCRFTLLRDGGPAALRQASRGAPPSIQAEASGADLPPEALRGPGARTGIRP